MVTILEPRTEVTVESIPLPEEPRQEGGYLEWTYAIPCAGVKYYSFQPERRPSRVERAGPDHKASHGVLAVQLIDERVILL